MQNDKPTLYGFTPSTFFQTAALALHEKGISFEHAMPGRMASEGPSHPFGKSPHFVHGGFSCFETLAICLYADEVLAEATLQPRTKLEKIAMYQWISVYLDYGVDAILNSSVRERFQNPMLGLPTDEARIRSSIPKMKYFCSVINNHLENSYFFSGGTISIADLFYIPLFLYFRRTPEGHALVDECSEVKRWLSRVCTRDSVQKVCIQL